VTRVSVGLPVYNGERYLAEALESLVTQTHEDLEIVLSDNGSTDGTAAICARYAARDPRVRYVRHERNRGGAFNHTFVAAQATAPYFRWFAADDVMHPRCVEEGVRVLDADPSVVLAWPDPVPLDAAGTAGETPPAPRWDDRSPATRLASLLRGSARPPLILECAPVYGLARRRDFLAAMPVGSFYGADNVVLVTLALRGRWTRLAPGRYFRRTHDGSSTHGRSRHEVAIWMDPATTPGRSLPHVRRLLGFARAVLEAPLDPGERLRCLGVLAREELNPDNARRVVWDLRVLARERAGEQAQR